LILGTMPSPASLAAGQYYAHPRNALWPILGALLDFDPAAPYECRTSRLIAARVALWDVLRACRRHGSLDQDIDRTSIDTNDFATFFALHPHIDRICFNGAAAETLYRRHVAPSCDEAPRVTTVRLPSTSPAHARLSITAKRAAWCAALRR
jgi:hypoxanthine-DNA glycosylase